MSLKNSHSKIESLSSFNQVITLPTSKSHCNRALILGAVKGGGFIVKSLSDSSDVINLLNAFKQIGLNVEVKDNNAIFHNSFPSCEDLSSVAPIVLKTGDGGTTNRFLLALLARGQREYHLYPSEKMAERPMEDLLNPLKKLSVFIEVGDGIHSPWIKVKGPANMYQTTKLEINCEKSTQFASALMLAFSPLPLQFEFKNVHASESYLEMTQEVLKKTWINNGYRVPVDFSSLGYPAALAALMGSVTVANCFEKDSFQADSSLLDLLAKIGAKVNFSKEGLVVERANSLTPFEFDISFAPDLFPTLVFLAAHIEGSSTLKKLAVLSFKESDRLGEMLRILDGFNVAYDYEASLDQLVIHGKADKKYQRTTINPARDHRIVMSAALFMAKNSGGELSELDCVEKSFPKFFMLLK